jgi:small-conductance mechanosensitive channel
MDPFLQLVGPQHTVQLFGIRLVGVNAENGKKVVLTVIFILLVVLLKVCLKLLLKGLTGEKEGRFQFWSRQGVRLLTTALLLIGLISIWFNNPTQLASAAAFVTAGLAIASQRMITAFAGYLIILRGKNFNVGDRIVMGGVRGDVIELGFMQTTIMEMGQPPGEQADAPSMWISARQYTGRIVTVTNDKIFDTPVYNYTTEFPYIWEEMRIPVPYNADRGRAEQILLDAARRRTTKVRELGEEPLKDLERRYMIKREDLEPKLYYRLTDNWCEMAVRFIVDAHEVRGVKDLMSRDILDGFDEAKIEIASGTYQIVGMPELRVRINGQNGVA